MVNTFSVPASLHPAPISGKSTSCDLQSGPLQGAQLESVERGKID